MPELPEVETIRRDLETAVLGRAIATVSFSDSLRYRNLHAALGKVIHRLSRRGKFLIVGFAGAEMIIHLGMSGRLFVAPVPPTNPHVRVVFGLNGSRNLVFVDVRRFGRLAVVKSGQYSSFPALASMGPEPLSADFDVEDFVAAMARQGPPVKLRLLSQRVVAGLGNIYADEALHRAGVHPLAQQLSRSQARGLHLAIRAVLGEAVERRGTTFSLYRDGLMREGDYLERLGVFRRTGEPCRICRTPICRRGLRGRSTHFCPICQPLTGP